MIMIRKIARIASVFTAGVGFLTLLAGCPLEPHHSTIGPLSALDLSAQLVSASVIGDEGAELYVSILPAETMESAIRQNGEEFMPELSAADYEDLIRAGRAAFAHRSISPVDDESDLLDFQLEPGEYHIRIELIPNSEDGESIHMDATFLDWSNLPAALSGDFAAPVVLSAGEATSRSFELREANYLYGPFAAPPTFSPEPGLFTEPLQVELETITEDAVIYYTLDGSVPDDTDNRYEDPISIEGEGTETTIKAIARAEGYAESSVVTGLYEIIEPLDEQTSFHTRWETSNTSWPGSSREDQIALPLEPAGSYDFIVDWGDGTADAITSSDDEAATHTYEQAGEYEIVIAGEIEGFTFGDAGDREKLLEIMNWGPLNLGNSGGYFQGATNLTITATDMIDLSGTTNMSSAFHDAASLETVPNMNDWDMSAVTDMSSMFEDANSFNQNLNGWNTSSVTDMSAMFRGSSTFNADISGWSTSNVTDMNSMFEAAADFDQDISGWDVGSVIDMSSMFRDAESFNQALNSWDTSSVTNMSGMFRGASTFNAEIDAWNVSNVTSMSSMFRQAEAFDQPIGNWDVGNVTDMRFMFEAGSGPLDSSAFNQDIGNWDVSSVQDMRSMFRHAKLFDQNLNGWDVSSVTSMWGMFEGAGAFNGNIADWDVSSVENMYRMFRGATVFNQDISGWDVSSVDTMQLMFSGARAFDQDIGGWDVSSVTRTLGMFEDAELFNQDISNWDVSNVTDTRYMFEGAEAFNQDIGGWDVSSVGNMGGMFRDALLFDQDLGGWDVSNVDAVNGFGDMFAGIALSTANYDALLLGWSNLDVEPGMTFDAGDSQYTEGAVEARDTLINDFDWTINDGGLQ